MNYIMTNIIRVHVWEANTADFYFDLQLFKINLEEFDQTLLNLCMSDFTFQYWEAHRQYKR